MRWLKRGMWKLAVPLAGVLLFLVLMVWVPVSAGASEGTSSVATPVTVQATPTVDVTATMTALNEQKLATDIRKENSDIFWGWTAIGTIVIGVAGVSVTFLQSFRNRRDTQDKELRDRAEERFQAAVTALGDKNEGTQVGGAILLRSFLNKQDEKIYERYYVQIFDLAVAYLRPSNESQPSRDNTPMTLTSFRHALVVVLQQSYPLVRDTLMDQKKSEFDHRILDASRICLDGAYLVESDLNRTWMIDAYLIGARLGRAKLHRADLRRAIIRRTFLNGADLSEATLFLAVFDNADLSGANLRGADLRGATFTEAILTNTDFTGAKLGEVTVLSKNFRSANPEEARSLKGTDLRGVIGLTKKQLEACKAKGAIIDEALMASPSQSAIASPSPSQITNPQPPSAPPAQVNIPPASTDGSNTTSAQPSTGP